MMVGRLLECLFVFMTMISIVSTLVNPLMRRHPPRHGWWLQQCNGLLSSDVSAPLYRSEGLLCVDKPLQWTSHDVVNFLRGMLERDSRDRSGGGRRRPRCKVGHGGTLDPLATGVLVIGVGRGTKMLQSYLQGNKAYTARGELGYETDTLDLDGVVTKRAPFSHVTAADLESILPRFTGSIYQVPPMYSAIKQGGKKLYQIAREGKTVPLLEARRVDIHSLSCTDASRLPHFDIFLECGGGTYVRSLIRDMGAAVGSAATTVSLRRVQQGPFLERHALSQDQWTPDAIYQAIDECQALLLNHENE